eukprot:CAMPEP_0205801432 /NCGR_PEP_ID=MMETSP0205-20121125/3421_1 /ASSEMBLY_ACC=CAM_ASM_000278 /TAXON_ID=36767 /ORGANISM="Euplotes focardii, Strain TN1" /LENGTH=132 /DNA_ID=CAMNT_0053066175 /DNA_START=216 /DNA_END=611 /DNA_ORIENTATION=+
MSEGKSRSKSVRSKGSKRNRRGNQSQGVTTSNNTVNDSDNKNETMEGAVKTAKKRVKSPHTYLKTLGLYSKNNLLEDILRMYKFESKDIKKSPILNDGDLTLKSYECDQIDYYTSLQNHSRAVKNLGKTKTK